MGRTRIPRSLHLSTPWLAARSSPSSPSRPSPSTWQLKTTPERRLAAGRRITQAFHGRATPQRGNRVRQFRILSKPSLTCWDADFHVTRPLPNASFPLTRNWAGNIAVNRAGFPNDTLFFWAWEREHGSLTAGAEDRSGEPWGIWLNGGYVLDLPIKDRRAQHSKTRRLEPPGFAAGSTSLLSCLSRFLSDEP
jgi:hypothetical protein